MKTQPSRILAVEIRAARLGYAVFETPRQLRDFGASVFTDAPTARRRIAGLLRLYRPTVLVLHGVGSRYPRDMRTRKMIARIASDEARKVAISVAWVSERVFQSYFERYSCRDKYDIASVLAALFPELVWRVPPAPDFYDPEPRSMLYFDAIALAVAHLQRNRTTNTRIGDDGILSPASK